jgi:hypothetical protein
MGTWEHITLGSSPRHNALGFLCWGRSLKLHIEIKREFFYGLKYYLFDLFGTW